MNTSEGKNETGKGLSEIDICRISMEASWNSYRRYTLELMRLEGRGADGKVIELFSRQRG